MKGYKRRTKLPITLDTGPITRRTPFSIEPHGRSAWSRFFKVYSGGCLDKEIRAWTIVSMMLDTTDDINERISSQVRRLRSAAGLSLDALAAKTGVSRSMLSLIERAECSPTAVILERLAVGLNVTLATLFEVACRERSFESEPILRRACQAEWRDPDDGVCPKKLVASTCGTTASTRGNCVPGESPRCLPEPRTRRGDLSTVLDARGNHRNHLREPVPSPQGGRLPGFEDRGSQCL